MVICHVQCNVSSRKVHSLCCKRNDDTGIFLVFLLVGPPSEIRSKISRCACVVRENNKNGDCSL